MNPTHEYERANPRCTCVYGLGMKPDCPLHGSLVRTAVERSGDAKTGEPTERDRQIAREAAARIHALETSDGIDWREMMQTEILAAITEAKQENADTRDMILKLARNLSWVHEENGCKNADCIIPQLIIDARALAARGVQPAAKEPACDCGGNPHGKFCALVLNGAVTYEPTVELPTPTTIGELRDRFTPAAKTDQQWQPRDTAPKDGTHILVRNLLTSFGFYDGKEVHLHTVVHWFNDGFYLSVSPEECQAEISFTHWMPLPAAQQEGAPAAEQDDGREFVEAQMPTQAEQLVTRTASLAEILRAIKTTTPANGGYVRIGELVDIAQSTFTAPSLAQEKPVAASVEERLLLANNLVRCHQEAWNDLAKLLGIKCWPMQQPRFVCDAVAALLTSTSSPSPPLRQRTRARREHA